MCPSVVIPPEGCSSLDGATFGLALALCGAVKYGGVPGMSLAQRVEGFFANVSGSKDEHAVIGAGAF